MLRFFRSLQRIDNSAGVLALKPAVCGDFSAAFAVAPRVHHYDVVTILQEKFRLTDNADAIIGNTVKEHDPRAIWIFCAHFPAPENSAIRRANCEIFATAVRVLKAFVRFADQIRRKRTLHGMEKHRPSKPATDCGQGRRKENQNQNDTNETLHLLTDTKMKRMGFHVELRLGPEEYRFALEHFDCKKKCHGSVRAG